MRVLICGINYAPDLIGVPKYNTEMAESLAALGHEVKVVTAPPYYPDWAVPEAYRHARYATETRNAVTLVRAPIYVPQRPSGAKRILHHASFGLSSLPPLISSAVRWRPDVVFAVAPSLLSAPGAWLCAKLSGALSWLHVQDLEIDAAFELGLLANARAREAMLAAERTLFRAFDRVSTISPQMLLRLKQKGVRPDRLREVRNWADTTAIRPSERSTAYRAMLGLGEGDTVVLYSGAMASKQGLEFVVEAARRTRVTHPSVHYVLCGNGPSKPDLVDAARDLSNVHFLDLQPVERLSELLSTADIHVMPQKAEAADLVLPSKLSGMLSSGRPIVVMASPGTGIAQETESCGLAIAPGDADALAAAVVRLAENEGMRVRLGRAARLRAEQAWDRHAITAMLSREFTALKRPLSVARGEPVRESRS